MKDEELTKSIRDILERLIEDDNKDPKCDAHYKLPDDKRLMMINNLAEFIIPKRTRTSQADAQGKPELPY